MINVALAFSQTQSNDSESIKRIHTPLKIDPIISGIHNYNLEITLYTINYKVLSGDILLNRR